MFDDYAVAVGSHGSFVLYSIRKLKYLEWQYLKGYNPVAVRKCFQPKDAIFNFFSYRRLIKECLRYIQGFGFGRVRVNCPMTVYKADLHLSSLNHVSEFCRVLCSGFSGKELLHTFV